jgi:hypothetical protein
MDSSAENVSEHIINSGKKIARTSQQIVPKMSAPTFHMPHMPTRQQVRRNFHRIASTLPNIAVLRGAVLCRNASMQIDVH